MKVLIIDDEQAICSSLKFALEDEFDVQATVDPYKGLAMLKEQEFDLCLLDLKIGAVNGLEILEEIKVVQPSTVVVMMTAYGSISSSVEAIKKGAYSYLTKPLHMEELFSTMRQAVKFQELNKKVEYLSQELEKKYAYEGIIGNSPAMKSVFELIDKVKDIDSNILVTGESGTGKELVVRAIHYSGKRKREHFEVVNCSAIPENLLESELFGHEKGAFTGAMFKREGKFQLAEGGTIFLDEIGEMPLALQAKLLRVIQQREVTPLGANKPVKLNVRIIAATNRDLKKAVGEGIFREDLYYRLNVLEINLPPLRERRQDLPLLIQYFIEEFNKELSKRVKGFSEEALKWLLNYDYPGNIRELANIVESAMIVEKLDSHGLMDLPRRYTQKPVHQEEAADSIEAAAERLAGIPLKEIEEKVILATLKKNGNHRKKTAEMLGISERGLREKLKNYKESGKTFL
ncbi:sigma-54-dependent transcriptional regulator [Bacillus norwichensis]|uniref:Sigma-54-dependent Fis family transcriptional regulator n=1 Tax=Bacillus norwichensis TaxID=2762217 RepID=A0ABR8VL87_9BACI|nr:sigma-54 dependent transcriptional regulator [Bacillus norwichensis]MBD8005530.1 sigma-54-dependent Fis family transcriptional regulator [Bacillus norwichensis]